MRILESLIMGLLLAAFIIVTIAAVACTFEGYPNKDVAGVGALAGGCILGLAILLHGAMTRRPPKE